MSAAEVIHTDPLAAAVGAVELALAAAPPWRRLLDVATDPAWSEPIAGLGLTPVEQAIVLVAVAPEVSRRAAELTAALGADHADCWPTVDLLVRLLQPADVRSALAPSAALVRRGVVTVHQAAGASSLLATVRPTTLVVEHLLGLPLTAHDAVVRRARRDASALAGTIDDDAAGELRAGVGRGGPLIVLASADAARAAADHIAAPGQRIVETQLAAPDPLLAETHLDAADDRAERCRPLDATERRAALRHGGLLAALTGAVHVVLAGEETDLDHIGGSSIVQLDRPPVGRPGEVVALAPPSASSRRRGWLAALCRAGTAAKLDAGEIDELVQRHHLTRGQVDALVADAARRGTVDFATLAEAASALLAGDLAGLATPVDRRASWDDLVVAPALLAELRHAALAIRHRHAVAALGVAHRRPGAPAGTVVLFAGPSGTGKTLAATVIATELSGALYRVDLANVVSKYIGETEKHLERVFAAAERAGALLLFDEADAIFAKRAEVREARDRYANLETSYLLQRIEQHDGAVILTTNARHHLDAAFQRRFAAIVQFTEPAEAERRRLWDVLLGNAPRAADLDLDRLARDAAVTGGEIAAVLLDAAAMAVAGGGPVDAATVAVALARLQQRRGR